MKPLIVSLALNRASGGPVKTITLFKKATKAHHICFVNSQQHAIETKALGEVCLIQSSKLPILRQLCYSKDAWRVEVEKLFRNAPIVSAHSFYRYHTLWVHHAYKRWGTPYWHVPHGILDPYVLTYGKLSKRLYLQSGGRAFIDDAVCTIFATKREEEKAESLFGPMNSEIVHWPVDLVDLDGRAERGYAARNKLGIPEDATVLLYFGRVQAMKRPFETIEAAAAVKSDNLHVIIVGPLEDISEADLRKEADVHGLNNFHFVGPVYGQEKYDYLFASDFYVSFSHRENFNHSAAEAMAAGLPVILSQGNDLGTEVESSGAGIYLHEDSSRVRIAALQQMCNMSPTERQCMGNFGRTWVERKLSFVEFESKLKNIIRKYGKHEI